MRRIFDISPPLSPETAVWPGDIPLSRSTQCEIAQGDKLTLSSLNTTVHIGAHADAPSHFAGGAPAIDAVALEPYIGSCTVVSCIKPRGSLIEPADCEVALAHGARRILFRTLSQPDSRHFNTDFVAFSPEAIRFMGERGVVLLGIDTASVDAFDSKDLRAHQMMLHYDIRNLESLDLSAVSDGDYELIALPLRLVGFDASPVRAILRTL